MFKTSLYHQQLQIKDAFSRLFILCDPGVGKSIHSAMHCSTQSVIEYRECHPLRSHFLKFRFASHRACYHFPREPTVPNEITNFLQRKKSGYSMFLAHTDPNVCILCIVQINLTCDWQNSLVNSRIDFQYANKKLVARTNWFLKL